MQSNWSEAVARDAAAHAGVAGELDLLRLAVTAVFRAGDVAVKVVPSWHRSVGAVTAEHELTSMLHQTGVPVPEPLEVREVDGFVVAMTRFVPSAGEPLCWRQLGEVVAHLHRTPPPVGTEQFMFGGAVYAERIRRLEEAAAIDAAAAEQLRDLLPVSTPVPGSTLVHGDLHEGNVLMSGGRLWLIDWENARCGPVEVDLCRPLVRARRYGMPARDVEAFWAGYGGRRDLDAELVGQLDARIVLSGITYLLSAAGAAQQAEGRRRLDDFLGGTQSVWRDV